MYNRDLAFEAIQKSLILFYHCICEYED